MAYLLRAFVAAVSMVLLGLGSPGSALAQPGNGPVPVRFGILPLGAPLNRATTGTRCWPT